MTPPLQCRYIIDARDYKPVQSGRNASPEYIIVIVILIELRSNKGMQGNSRVCIAVEPRHNSICLEYNICSYYIALCIVSRETKAMYPNDERMRFNAYAEQLCGVCFCRFYK